MRCSFEFYIALIKQNKLTYDRDLFLTLDSNFMRFHVAIMLKIQNIKRAYMLEVWLCKGAFK